MGISPQELTKNIKNHIISLGADLVGITETEPFQSFNTHPPDLLDKFSHAISIGLALPKDVFETIIDQPTPIYASCYQTANRILDEIAFKTCSFISKSGFAVLPIPASQLIDTTNWYGAISHKAIARMAGLGWQGKSLLLITPKYGPRVRLVTVLVNAPLIPDAPVKNRCGKCTECQKACPAQAIKGVKTETHYQNREEALDFTKCMTQLVDKFSKLPKIEAPICGFCIKACPHGK